MPDGRVLIAETAGPLDPNPTWTRYDELPNCRCPGYDITTGRHSEFDVVETGSAQVFFNDRNQTMNDPALVGKQILLQAHDPVADLWFPQFRGIIDEPDFDVSPTGVKATVSLNCVDVMDYLGRAEFTVDGTFGDAGGPTGVVFYEDGSVDGRIEQILTECGVDPDMYVVFSGNVDLIETRYDAGDAALTAIRDAVDAEFPGIGLAYVDKAGRFVFHGRFARLDPEGTAASASPGAWDFISWTAGDGAFVEGDPFLRAQIRTFAHNYPASRIINSYQAWARSTTGAAPDVRVATDATSITNYGIRGRSAPDLILAGHKTNGNTAADELDLVCSYYVSNYKNPARNVRSVTFKSVRPDDDRAECTWNLMTAVQISDRITLTVADAGADAEAYFVEGLSISLRQLNPDIDYMEVTPNLSPAAYFTDDVFNP
jgi:hypothetical protein